jgi:hypothetical protein
VYARQPATETQCGAAARGFTRLYSWHALYGSTRST